MKLILRNLICALSLLMIFETVMASPQEIVERLDYIAVDYPEAIKDGVIINAGEYKEMQEFSEQVRVLGQALSLEQDTAKNIMALERLIETKAAPDAVALKAREISAAINLQYHLIVPPKTVPRPSAAKVNYEKHCAGCHGVTGRGDGVLAGSLTPKPTNFHDIERAKLRSINGLYNTITSGVAQTSMTAFEKQLTEAERWDLAFYVGQMYATEAQITHGEMIWKQLKNKNEFTPERIVSLAPAEELAANQSMDLLAYLRLNPQLIWDNAHLSNK